MSANPFNLQDRVEGNFQVERSNTMFQGINDSKLKWHNIEGYEYLTLDEILEQAMKNKKTKEIPFIRVNYEHGLWGVIFEIGNYKGLGKQWIVHGITKGYA